MFLPNCKLHFVRHGETTFKKVTQAFQQSRRIALGFDELCASYPQFLNQVRFHPSQIDCSLTDKGKFQCQNSIQHLKSYGINPDLILVSPFNRCLQTSQYMFGSKTSIDTIVQPLVGEIMKSACDISNSLQKKTKKFYYNFEQCQPYGDRWYLWKNSEKHRIHYKHILESQKQSHDEDEIQEVIRLMHEKNLVETQQHLYERCERFIEKIENVYAPKFKNIVVISHYMFINCVTSKEYEENTFNPKNGLRPKNCEVNSIQFKDLLSKSKISSRQQKLCGSLSI